MLLEELFARIERTCQPRSAPAAQDSQTLDPGLQRVAKPTESKKDGLASHAVSSLD